MKRVVLVLLLLSAMAGGGYYYYMTQQRLPVTETTELTLYGNIDIRDVALAFRVAGRIQTLSQEEGDQVHRGDVLAVLDTKPFMDELALRQASLQETEAAVKNAEKLYARSAELLKKGAISQGAFDDAFAARDEARARVKTAQAQVNIATTSLQDSRLLAPNDGIILTRVREEGSIVSTGQPVYTLALNDPVWVRTYVNEPDLGYLSPGQQVTVTTDSHRTYQGQIGFISPQAEFTPKTVETTQLRTDLVYRLRVIVANPDAGLRQGMPVTVTVPKPVAGQP
ncbi:efflux RND transporter periplasmic adaptor subunit [Gynuella sunshinyii]|uniref:Multidrug resistance efflux pump n=1 Tax=Gynuella sunshinyii YC6258 TaxID=1445510 RepID=A0A0C5VQ37_9GAMM|nr:efflux RND transporter periplasmic adaptor subunit [Gynuella sunshinyii]AJQ92399.1 multidrug resistance efflux pump [Gynuella sunshinyii YC6258]